MAKKNSKKANYYAEDRQLDDSYNKTSGKYAKKKAKKQRNGFAIAACILIPLLVLGMLGYYFFFMYEPDDQKILPNVTVAGVDVGGLSKEQAISAVQTEYAAVLAKDPMTVVILDQELQLTPEQTGVSLDVTAAVEAAYELGRTGSSVQRKEEQLLAATTGIQTDITSFLTFNEDGIRAQLDTLDIAASGALVETTWELTGEKPDLQTEETPSPLQTLLITKGSPAYSYDENEIVRQILKAYAAGEMTVTCDCSVTEPQEMDLDAIYAEITVPMTDAQMDPETFEVISHTYGYDFDLDAAKAALAEADYGEAVEIPFRLEEPMVYAADLSAKLFCDTLSSYESYQASNSSRATNMRLACEAINGTVLLPGEVFSFNDTVGERTKAKGYQPAPSYEGGKTVMTYGGGVCQPSSTIYYCALLADMEIVERDCHSYPSYYVPWGMDATVNWLTLDFKFRNNSDYPIRIDASADDKGTVSIAIVGTDTRDTYVKMEYEIIGYYPHETKEVHFTEDNNPNGYKDGQVITSPVDGYKVRTFRCRYDKQTDELIERLDEATSVYSKRDKEVAVLDKPAETEPPATEPPATEPPSTEPPATEPPATDPPATEPPVTEPPATEPPATEPPATEPPATEPPAPADVPADPPADAPAE